MLPEKDIFVKRKFDSAPQRSQKRASPANKLALCSGEKVKPKRHGNQPAPQPPRPVLTISKHISLALTLDKYGIHYNAETVRRIGGKK